MSKKKFEIIKYLPKSKLGAAFAIPYLLILAVLISLGTFGGGGLHSGGTMALFLAITLTLPLSYLLSGLLFALNFEALDDSVEKVVIIGVLIVSALINAGLIYLTFGFLSRAFASFRNSLK